MSPTLRQAQGEGQRFSFMLSLPKDEVRNRE